MIERTNAFKVGDKGFLSLVDAQKYEIQQLLLNHSLIDEVTEKGELRTCISNWMIENQDVIVDILTTTRNSKTKARKIHGGTKKKVLITNVVNPVVNSPEN